MSIDIHPEVAKALERRGFNVSAEEKPFLNEQPLVVQHLFRHLEALANVLWSEEGYDTYVWHEGRSHKVNLKGEAGFECALDICPEFRGYSKGIRRCFTDCPVRYKDWEVFPMEIPEPQDRKSQRKTSNYAFLVHESRMLIIQFRPWRLYEFDRIEGQPHLVYGLTAVRSDEVNCKSLLETLRAFRDTGDFNEFNEEGRRKVGSLIKYLETHYDEDEGDEVTR